MGTQDVSSNIIGINDAAGAAGSAASAALGAAGGLRVQSDALAGAVGAVLSRLRAA
jgi:methyl-accepting chemotaxis protein